MSRLASLAQPRILAEPSSPALLLTFGLRAAEGAGAALAGAVATLDLSRAVIGVGAPLAEALGAVIPELRTLEPVSGRGVAWPSTQGALWVALYGGDDGTLLHEGRALAALLGAGFTLDDAIPAYTHRDGRDLTGFVDGTANPLGADAVATAIADGPDGLAGGSYVAVQRWVHDLDAIAAMSQGARDHMVGRRVSDNEEIDDAPASAHVKRTAQEEAGFLLRRSMPWGSVGGAGLAFVAYANDPAVFLRHARRMVGAEDGVVDALYRVTRPVSGGAYWCPPVRDGRVDLRALGG